MSFRETFREYTDYYTVIGGTACMILMEEASRDFRTTKDVDMIFRKGETDKLTLSDK